MGYQYLSVGGRVDFDCIGDVCSGWGVCCDFDHVGVLRWRRKAYRGVFRSEMVWGSMAWGVFFVPPKSPQHTARGPRAEMFLICCCTFTTGYTSLLGVYTLLRHTRRDLSPKSTPCAPATFPGIRIDQPEIIGDAWTQAEIV